MAAKLSSGGKGKYDIGANADINVTPFVDIMLVLLIVFMVAAPLATVSIKLDMPPASANSLPNEKPTFISIQQSGQLYIVDQPTSLARLGADLNARMGAGATNKQVFVRADKSVKYNSFMEVVNQLQEDGFYKIGLINEDLTGV